MDRGAWRATVPGVTKSGHDWSDLAQPSTPFLHSVSSLQLEQADPSMAEKKMSWACGDMTDASSWTESAQDDSGLSFCCKTRKPPETSVIVPKRRKSQSLEIPTDLRWDNLGIKMCNNGSGFKDIKYIFKKSSKIRNKNSLKVNSKILSKTRHT